jgi:large subunit ribosomal protein L29
MALPKIADARDLSDENLSQEIIETKKKLANLRLLKATGRLENTHEFKHARHWLAQLLTVEGERQRPAETAVSE